jgi:hypothetical protein
MVSFMNDRDRSKTVIRRLVSQKIGNLPTRAVYAMPLLSQHWDFRLGFGRNMGNLLIVIVAVFMSWMHNAQAQPVTVDPESIVPLPDKFDIGMPPPGVPPEIARFHGAWIGTWGDDIRTILVVERVKPDGRADVVFAHGDSAFYDTYREWWRTEAKIAAGVMTIAGEAMKILWLRALQYAFDGPDRLFLTSTYRSGDIMSGALVRTDVTRLAAGDRPVEWPRPGERVSIPHLMVRTPDGTRPIMLEGTFYVPVGPGPAPLAIITHGSDAGRNQLIIWSFSTEAHWLHDNGFAVLALMRRGARPVRGNQWRGKFWPRSRGQSH